MKTTNYMIAAAVTATFLFAGCKKDDTAYNVAADERLMAPAITGVNFQLQVIPQRPGYMLAWNKGYISATEVLFDGVYVVGNELLQKQFAGKTLKTIDLITPSKTLLGTANVIDTTFAHAAFTVDLEPVNPSGQNETNSLFLAGTFYTPPPPGANVAPFNPIPVQIIINTPVSLNSMWLNDVIIGRRSYDATIVLDINQLTNGIDENMLDNATQTNGTIFITSTSNLNIYSIIVSNLENNVMKAELSSQFESAANPAE